MNRRIRINAVCAVGQTVVVALSLFFLYKYLLRLIGVENLGIWSTILATTSVARIMDLGFSDAIVKFVAAYLETGDRRAISEMIQTSVVSMAVMLGVALVVLYPVIRWLLVFILPPASLETGRQLLLCAVVSFWCYTLASFFQSCYDGFHRIDLRAVIVSSAAVIYLVLALFLAGRFGLMGLAYAQVIHSSVTAVVSWILLKLSFPWLPLVPVRWFYARFRECLGFTSRIMVINWVNFLLEPVSKAFMARFGGLSAAGYYDMANRMVQQVRALIISANRVLVPAFARLSATDVRDAVALYTQSFRAVLIGAFSVFSLIMVLIPAVSWIMIGSLEERFILYAFLLGAAWLANILIAPAYFANIGMGELNWNVIGHVCKALLNLMLAWTLGRRFGAIGVVLGFVAAMLCGDMLIPWAFHARHGVRLGILVPRAYRLFLLAAAVGTAFGLGVYVSLWRSIGFALASLAAVLSPLLILGTALWRTPLREDLRACLADSGADA